MRGTARPVARSPVSPRITPADAGNRYQEGGNPRSGSDHSRGCGEQSKCFKTCFKGLGSPPRMRGTGSRSATEAAQVRITPADAGNSVGLLGYRSPCADHPRGCGEQLSRVTVKIGGVGSPPRMRGTASVARSKAISRRITPADAGNRYQEGRNPCSGSDHPRGCGEQHMTRLKFAACMGSPPRMRGTVLYMAAAVRS